MTSFSKQIQIRWSDLDPNFHVRHSVYYDWGALVRVSLLTEAGLTPAMMLEHHVGPILFREEAVFKKEIHHNDAIAMNLQLLKSTRDGGRWTMMHEIWRNGDTLCAIITVDGAWIDTQMRKLAVLPESFRQGFDHIPKAESFQWIEK